MAAFCPAVYNAQFSFHEKQVEKTLARQSLSHWAFDFAFLVAEFRTTTPESVNSSSIVVCRGLWRPISGISKTYSTTYSLDENPLHKKFHCKTNYSMDLCLE